MYQQPPYPPDQPPQQPPPYPQQPYYPPGPPPMMQPPKRPRRTWLWIVLGVVALLLFACIGAVALAGRGMQPTTSTTTNSNTPPAAQSQGSQHFKVGQAVKVGDTWQVTVISAKTSSGSDLYKPQKAGNVFLIFAISMKNISSSEQNVSSLVQWSVQDTSGQKYTETIDPDAGATLDGKVEAGAPIKGAIVYEVPKSTHDFTLSFQVDIASAGQTIWDIHV